MRSFARIYTGNDGLSHFEELPLPLKPFVDTEGAYGEGTPMEVAKGVTFRVASPGYFLDWHRAPRRQYIINLSGEVEIQASDGSALRLKPGDILLAEDVAGKGHTTRVLGNEPRFYAVVPLAD